MAIIDQKKNNDSAGLLGKLQIGSGIYEVKDIVAREAIDTLNGTSTEVGSVAYQIFNSAKDGTFTFAGSETAITIANAIQANADAISAAGKGMFKVVESESDIPVSDAGLGYIYLVPDAYEGYKEWIVINTGTEAEPLYVKEEIGDTHIDLSDYVTTDDLTTAISGVTADINALDTSLSDSIATEIAAREAAIAALETSLTDALATEVAAREALETTLDTVIGSWSSGSAFENDSIREAIESVYSAIAGQSTGTFVTSVELDTAWAVGSVSTLAMDTTDSELAVFTAGTTPTFGGLEVGTALAVIPSNE